MSLFNLSSLNNAISYSALENDMKYIVQVTMNECNQDLEFDKFLMKKGYYTDSCHMYNDIIKIIQELGMIQDYLEMMPYIDDYMEYYFT
jgi:hypothetical protein